MSSSNQRSAQTANHASGWSSTTTGCCLTKARTAAPPSWAISSGRVRGQHPCGGLGMVQAQQATEGPAAVCPVSVQAYGAQHRGPRPFHVLAPGSDPSPDDLGEQGMDPVAREPVGRPVAHPGHHQPGGLELGQGGRRLRVTGQVPGGVHGDDLLVGHAQQQVAVLGREARRTPPPRRRRRRGTPVAEALCGHERVARRGEAPGGQHHRRTPSLRVLGDGPGDLDGVGARVLGDEGGRVALVETEQLPPEHREVAEQLGPETRDGQVPPRHQQDAETLGGLVQPLVDQADAGQRQQVGVVDDDQARCGCLGILGGQQRFLHAGRLPAGVGGDPPRVLVAAALEPAADAEGLARPHRADQQRQRVGCRGVEPVPEQGAGHVHPRQPGPMVTAQGGLDGTRTSAHAGRSLE